MTASFEKYILRFKQASGTSRGVLREKTTYFLRLSEHNYWGIGECNMFKGLSADDVPDYEDILTAFCADIDSGKNIEWEDWRKFPSIQFGYEQALLSLKATDDILIPSRFTEGREGIRINGLIWMGDKSFMKRQISEKLETGFHCLKLKIGTNWNAEKDILIDLRRTFGSEVLELRVDANGAFSPEETLDVLDDLAGLKVHSIEQPIKANQIEALTRLCTQTPIPIALDEELIGVFEKSVKQELIRKIQPQYIILKPALVGGFQGSTEWIDIAESNNVGWWVTSALESNVGLNALAQWTYNLKNPMPQGLGTGSLYTNNIPSQLEVRGEELWFNA